MADSSLTLASAAANDLGALLATCSAALGEARNYQMCPDAARIVDAVKHSLEHVASAQVNRCIDTLELAERSEKERGL